MYPVVLTQPDGIDFLRLIRFNKDRDRARIGSDIPDPPTRPEFAQSIYRWTPDISPSCMIYYTGDLFPEWQKNLLIGGLSSKALVRLTWTGSGSRTRSRSTWGCVSAKSFGLTRRGDKFLPDEPAKVSQQADLGVFQAAWLGVDDAKSPHTDVVGEMERTAGIESDTRFARHRGMVSEAGIEQRVRHDHEFVT